MNRNIFDKKLIYDELKKVTIDTIDIEKARCILEEWAKMEKEINAANELKIRPKFVNLILCELLEYEEINNKTWSIDVENNRSDAVLGQHKVLRGKIKTKAKAVVEFKGACTNIESPTDQGFGYSENYRDCKWIITSNMRFLRLYHINNRTEFEEFDLLNLYKDKDEIKKFIHILSKRNLVGNEFDDTSRTDKLYTDSVGYILSKANDFYKEYIRVFNDIVQYRLPDQFPKASPSTRIKWLYKTQLLLNRVIFTFFCEKYGLLESGTFRSIISTGDKSKKFELFCKFMNEGHKADKNVPITIPKFNGGLFAHDKLLDGELIPTMSNLIFSELISLNTALRPFTDIDVAVLGHIFEESLDYIESKTSEYLGKKEKSDLGTRRGSAIFYTSKPEVQTVIMETLGNWCDQTRAKCFSMANSDLIKGWLSYFEQLKTVRVIDKTCGSGAFLIEDLEWLLYEWNMILSNLKSLGIKLPEMSMSQSAIGRYIISNNLFGVDIQEASIYITRLSLWMKTAEKGETLPDLGENVKCADSLAADFDKLFPNVMAEGGFDVDNGNPAYISHVNIAEEYKPLLKTFEVHTGRADYSIYFIEKGLDILKNTVSPYRSSAKLGFIITRQLFRADYGSKIRNILLDTRITYYKDMFDHDPFPDAAVDPCIFVVEKPIENIGDSVIECNDYKILQSSIPKTGPWSFSLPEENKIRNRLERKNKCIKDLNLTIKMGIKTALNKVFIIDGKTKDRLIKKNEYNSNLINPVLRGKDIGCYNHQFADKWIITVAYGQHKDIKKNYPDIYEYLAEFKDKLKNRGQVLGGQHHWLELDNCQTQDDYTSLYRRPKIVYSEIVQTPHFYLDYDNFYLDATAFAIIHDDVPFLEYLIALLNSSLLSQIFKKFYSGGRLGKNGYRYKKKFLENLPIPTISKEEMQPYIEASHKLISLNKSLNTSNDLSKIKDIGDHINTIKENIDNRIAELIGITKKEIDLIKKF